LPDIGYKLLTIWNNFAAGDCAADVDGGIGLGTMLAPEVGWGLILAHSLTGGSADPHMSSTGSC